MTYTVKQLDQFSDWLKGLKDELTRQRLVKRLRKAQLRNLGDVEPWWPSPMRKIGMKWETGSPKFSAVCIGRCIGYLLWRKVLNRGKTFHRIDFTQLFEYRE